MESKIVLKEPLYPYLEAEMRMKGYNCKLMAAAIGVYPSYINRRMKGEVEWDIPTAFKIADLLGSTVDKLFRKRRKEKVWNILKTY